MVYPIVFSFVALIAIIYLYQRIYSNKSPTSYVLWGVIWFLIIIFAFVPEASSNIAKLFGIARGLDFLVIVAIVLMFYLIFKLYMKIDKLQQDMSKIVRAIALNNEIIEESYDEEES
ncbi:MAG: DUF2304 family protein [Methanobrevibacter sp.]|uniref:DUF2304 domain-containing protein n=1 Tax=Methanobrevibacter sp. TaxID=66852 RepID=UPI0026E103AD|nr:DUF2304 family protein [Methanobrevibacter sp.]MDO5849368.1 DUF2304 family protein [Methanobrevibacter sp.]